MIRLTEDVMLEVQKRGCPPLETFIFTVRLKMWPAWQKGMADHVDGVKKLAEGTSITAFVLLRFRPHVFLVGSGGGSTLGSMFRKAVVSDATVKSVSSALHFVLS